MKVKIKLGDMTVNKRNEICQKQASCTNCPLSGRTGSVDWSVCHQLTWSVFPNYEIEIDEEDLK